MGVQVPFSCMLVSQYHLLKRRLSPSAIILSPCRKSTDCKCTGLFLNSQFYSTEVHVYLVPVPHCPDYYTFKVNFEIRKCSPLTLFSYFKIVWATLGQMHFHMNFTISFSVFLKMASGILIGIVLDLQTYLGTLPA